MKVVCDNCSAVYKVPDEKLTKPVNKATCRQCGHRMLIPRPRVDADPNERTLVTAVPPTPMGAPPRDVPWTPNTSSRPERTLPGRPAPAGFSPSLAGEEVPVFPGTPMPLSARRQAPSAAAIQSIANGESPEISLPPQPSRRPSLAAQPTAPAPPSASRGLPSSGPMPSPLQQQPTMPAPNRRRSPAPSLTSPPPVANQQAPRPNSVAPPIHGAPPSQTSTAVPAMARGVQAPMVPVHDPSNDLTIALAGVFGSLAGVFVLALLSVWPWRLILWIGLTIAIGGSITAILVLITSQRGTRPAWIPTSLLTGGILAVALATGIMSTHFVGERLVELDLGQLAKISFVTTPNTTLPVEPAQPIAPKPATDPEADPDEPEAVVDPKPEQPKPTTRPKPERPRPERPRPVRPRPEPVRPAPVRPAPVRPVPAPIPTPRPVVAPPPVAPPTPAPAASVSFEVIDVMLRNNLPVKKCFYDFGQSTGQLPPRVGVNFNLMPTGSVTGVNIRQAQYKGSPLESCLGSAIRNVKFPPSSGNGQKIVYPFVLQ